MAQRPMTMRLMGRSTASPEAVHDLLSDLSAHLRWAGSEQAASYRLLTVEASDAPAVVGTEFVTTGVIPLSRHRWEDRSTVVQSIRPLTFAFITDAVVVRGRRAMRAQYNHTYTITSCGEGCTVTYELTQERIDNPWLRLRLPVIRSIMWRFAAPIFARRGFVNLLHDAETASRST